MKKLVIVESPTKVSSVGRYLGDGYVVMSSVGHIRDLPAPSGLTPDLKRSAHAQFAVNIENDFEPYYVVLENKKKVVEELQSALNNSDELLIATDGDREGEAIAWHLVQVLKPTVPVRRLVFHEITREAIAYALQHPRPIDENLVDAQEARRILDRLYGYELSPVLWKKVRPGLSAGRVQSPATRLLVDRERERINFKSAEYQAVTADFQVDSDVFSASLTLFGERKIATGRDFDNLANLKTDALVLDKNLTDRILEELKSKGALDVEAIDSKPYSRNPYAPFITSTLQQDAAHKLGFSAKRTMRTAQQLYEKGFITYMRTDSPRLSLQAISAARAQVELLYGREFLPDSPRTYGAKAKNAQEAHEAIRPTGEVFERPESIESVLSVDCMRLYDLIWRRTIASQMVSARGKTVTLTLSARIPERSIFVLSGTVLHEKGFLKVYEGLQDLNSKLLPNLQVGDQVTLVDVRAVGHTTLPPPRYTEASLVKVLEELGLGRPSTYALILSTIQERGYAHLRNRMLVPDWLAFSVVNLLENFFSRLIDYDFTANLEDQLDEIALGSQNRSDWLRKFYFGDDNLPGLKEIISGAKDIDARAINSIPMVGATLRVGRYGPYLEVGDKRFSIPHDVYPDALTPEKIHELVNQPESPVRELGAHPETGKLVVLKSGRFGPYIEEVSDEKNVRRSSLFKNMDPEEVNLDVAVKLLEIPRVIGVNQENGEKVIACNGRFGPYIKCGKETRPLDSEDDILSVTLDEALAILSAPKVRRSRVLMEFPTDDPVTRRAVQIKSGRFGPYVTDGVTNATLDNTSWEDVTFDEAVSLLAEKRQRVDGDLDQETAEKIHV
ncbi:MAG: type I DNA topoisomerase [Tropheryma whipplei]|nr:type I DNA topoisomerase [Tropheryma whipplei]